MFCLSTFSEKSPHSCRFILLILALSSVFINIASAQTPPLTSFHPGETWKDDKGIAINAHGGGVLFQNGTYYWYGEHKTEGPGGNSANVGVHVYSSTDLYNWKDEGIALPVSQDPASEIAKGCIIERPKVLYNAKTKKYVMWFHLELKGTGYAAARCGVATSDKPTGPFTYVGSLRPDAGAWPLNLKDDQKKGNLLRDFQGGQMARDMTLFQDDDGKAYLICSSEENQVTHISQLTDDYLATSGTYIRAFHWTSEAPSVFNYQGKYYYIGSHCSGWNPNPAMSAVADAMLAEWKSLGDPSRGTPEQNKTTFESQPTFILPVQGKAGAFIYMGDRWQPGNAIDGTYVWLPIQFEDGKPVLKWLAEWNLASFPGSTP